MTKKPKIKLINTYKMLIEKVGANKEVVFFLFFYFFYFFSYSKYDCHSISLCSCLLSSDVVCFFKSQENMESDGADVPSESEVVTAREFLMNPVSIILILFHVPYSEVCILKLLFTCMMG